MAEMFVVLLFAKVLSIKYVHWNQQDFFDSESPLYALWERNGVTKTINYAFDPISSSLFFLSG